MTKQNKRLILFFSCFIVIVAGLHFYLPRPHNWTRNYLSESNAPFGCSVVVKLIPGSFASGLRVNSESLNNLQRRGESQTSLVMCDDQVALNRTESLALLRFLAEGNKVLLCGRRFSGLLADTFHLHTVAQGSPFYPLQKITGGAGSDLSFKAPFFKVRNFHYAQKLTASAFAGYDSTLFTTMAEVDSAAVLIGAEVNGGQLFLCTTPDLLTNFFVARHPNREAAYTILSLLANRRMVWDEYYKAGKVRERNPLALIHGSDALYHAWLLLLFILVVYVLLESRRRQRAIPLITPPANTTLEFVAVIGNCYFNADNHKYVAAEKIRHFYEYLRRTFSLDPALGDAVTHQLSKLSGVHAEEVSELLRTSNEYLHADVLSQEQLLTLNALITRFKTRNKR